MISVMINHQEVGSKDRLYLKYINGTLIYKRTQIRLLGLQILYPVFLKLLSDYFRIFLVTKIHHKTENC